MKLILQDSLTLKVIEKKRYSLKNPKFLELLFRIILKTRHTNCNALYENSMPQMNAYIKMNV